MLNALRRFGAALTVAFLMAGPSAAVQPDEVLADPVLEERAREISRDLRCLVCRNESIDESNAQLARDLRLLVRERLVAGDSNAGVVDFVVDRYGEYVLLRPRTSGSNLVLYLAGPVMLIIALFVGLSYARRRSVAATTSESKLTADETARLQEILKK
ncbi:cytochrome c-type biogenesis protein CcmH [Shimia sp. R10_1]|uniref:cytochrome c-type biogenesis protein n=1 Tax=Shimia sp. R10_1 TaxID=2821095 RepID=UPI001ADB9459|nr:cytochrome c-type biogenesis protein [Shimia sp. R10_1]MBO9472351.1 cytochrome c-type biogenesis protein CcmH [Shimia sp. R10_1]